MKDQVQNLRKRGIKALSIYSGMSRQDIITTLENCIFGNYKFLYISFFRLDDCLPAFLKIAEIRDLLPDVPVLALTATATPEVV